MVNRGSLVIVGILVAAVAAAGFSTWYHYRGSHRALDFWSSGSALLIAEGPHAKLLRLGDSQPTEAMEDTAPASDADGEPKPGTAVEFGEDSWKVVDTKSAEAARGISNIRRALILDSTFDWKPSAEDAPAQWQYAIAIDNDKQWATVLFDFASRQVGLAGGRKTALLDESASKDFQEFFAEQFPDEPPAPVEVKKEQPAAESSEPKKPEMTIDELLDFNK